MTNASLLRIQDDPQTNARVIKFKKRVDKVLALRQRGFEYISNRLVDIHETHGTHMSAT